jgi:hypothetical protein
MVRFFSGKLLGLSLSNLTSQYLVCRFIITLLGELNAAVKLMIDRLSRVVVRKDGHVIEQITWLFCFLFF